MRLSSPAYSLPDIKTNVLSGLTVALAMIPEAIAFALVAHVSPLTGLYTAFIVALITSVFGGRPGMVSGATGSLAVVLVSLVSEHGTEYLFATVVVMGLLQTAFGLARLGKFIRMVPHPVMLGFVNGLAIVIFLAQLGHFKTAAPDGSMHWMQGTAMATMIGLVVLTMIVIYLMPRITRAVPATLAGIVVVSLLVIGLGISTKTVGDLGSIGGGLPSLHMPQVPWNWATLEIVFPYALILALIGLTESLLTLNLIDEITDTRGKPNRECLAQGAANLVNGFFGGMGGCALIGQSMININNGARLRLSSVVMSLFLLSFILFGAPVIERIPLAALIGVMFVVSEKTFEWGSLRALRTIPRADAIIVVLVTVVTVFTDLAVAVVLGVVIAALVFAWQHAKTIQVETDTDARGWKTYALQGTLFFASAAGFASLFSPKDDPDDVVIDFKRSRVMDHSALEAIESLAGRYAALGKRLHLRYLSPDCLELLQRVKGVVEIEVGGNPYYHIADNRLG